MILLAGLAATIACTLAALAWQRDQVRAELARRAGSDVQALRVYIDEQFGKLEAVRAFVHGTRNFHRGELETFVSELSASSPAVEAIDWLPRVAGSARSGYEEAQWHDGHPGFRITERTPLGEQTDARARPEYFPVHLGMALDGRIDGLDLVAGSDLGAVASISEAMDKARNRDRLVSTGPLPGDVPRILALAPVYRRRKPFEDAARSKEDLLGFAVGVFRVSELIDGVFTETDRADFSHRVTDVGTGRDSIPIWQRNSAAVGFNSPQLALWRFIEGGDFQWATTLEVGTRTWELRTIAAPRFVASNLRWFPWVVLLAGLAVNFLVFASVRASTAQTAEISALHRRFQREQREANQRLGELSEEVERERSERKRSDAGLFREKHQFQLMFNAVPVMIWHKDTKNRFITVNEAAAASLGMTAGEIEGKPCSEIFPDRAYDLYRDDLEIIQSGQPKLGAVEQLRFSNGETLWVRTDKLPEFDAMGRVIGILVFAQDITQLRRAEDECKALQQKLEERVEERTSELRAINEELESFSYSVSHDLRTPLRAIDGFNQVVLEDFGDKLDETGREYLRRSRAAAQRMGRLIDDLMKLTRVTRAQLRRERLDLSSLARTVADTLAKAHPDRRVSVKISDSPLTRGDPVLMLNVLQNLLGNAWKFTATVEAPLVQFGSMQNEDGETVYFVRDNGVGFDMIYADKLFGAFERLHAVDEFEGSGIGLATVHLIMRRHGGRVWADSAPGEGATFYFTL